MTAKERADSTGPHKILTLDGGGVRGALTIEILAKIEKIAQSKGADTLSDYFDYFSGTSTGAILATCLSMGWSVDKLRKFYETRGEEMFDKASLLKRMMRYTYEAEPLAKLMQEEIGADVTLDSDKLKTLLMMVMRNATTDSPWPVSNNPYAKYNSVERDDNNGKLPLWQLVRASTAAPVYFPPECVKIGNQEFIFVDGGITCYNNPSFHTFLMATAEPYGVNWQTGEDQLLVVSLGTGTNPEANDGLAVDDMNLIYNATKIPSALMNAALHEQDFLCRTFGKCLSGAIIDREVGDMCVANDSQCGGPVNPKLFTYMRYNAELSKQGLEDLGVGDIDPGKVQMLDDVEGIPDLQRVGRAVAEQQVKAEHFAAF